MLHISEHESLLLDAVKKALGPYDKSTSMDHFFMRAIETTVI